MATVLLLIPLKKNTFLWIMGGLLLFMTDYSSTRAHFENTQIEISLKNCLQKKFGWVICLFLCLSWLSTWTSSPVSHCLLTSSAIKSVLSLRRLRWCLQWRLFWVLVLEFGCDPASWLWLSSHCATMHVPTCPDIELFLVHMEMDVAPTVSIGSSSP